MFGLKAETLQAIIDTLANHPSVEKAILYGSRAKGNYRTGSDIDITLKGKGLDLTQLQRLENELDELDLPYKIDLSIFHHI
jgi:predicted nucleotidyltransferase